MPDPKPLPEEAVSAPEGGLGDPVMRAFGLEEGQGDEWIDLARRAEGPAPPLGRLGPYELLEEIGRGGQGTVYRACQPGTQRVVALKRLGSGVVLGSRGRDRFEREVQALTRMAHPGIVTVHAADVIDGHPVLVMEWVQGRSIDEWARGAWVDGQERARGDFSGRSTVLACFAAVLEAVAYAHRRGVLHRDLKPSNIQVDEHGRPRILDFGLAKLAGEEAGERYSLTRTHSFMGTPVYCAPEQLQGRWEQVDTRADIYSLGAVLYTLLCGAPPFDASRPLHELVEQVSNGTIDTARLRRCAGRDGEAIVRMALEVDPDRRYQSVEAFAADLQRWERGEPVLAHPPSATYRMGKWVSRHRAMAVGSGASLLMVMVFAVVVTLLAGRLARERATLSATLEREREALLVAEEASLRAQFESSRQQTVANFLQELLANIGAASAEPPQRQVLDRAVAALNAGRLNDQPETEVIARSSIAFGYRTLGLHEQELAQSELALTVAEHLPAPDVMLVSRMLNRITRGYEVMGRLAEAETAGRRALALRVSLEGEDGLGCAGLLSDLASVLDEQGRYAESEAMYRRALGILLTYDRPGSVRVATARRNIGLELLEQGHWVEAEDWTRQALNIFAGAGATGLDAHCRARRNLARILHATGRSAEAESLLRESLRDWDRTFGDIVFLAFERTRLAQILHETGRGEEALRIYRDSVRTLEERLNPSHYWAVKARLAWAAALGHEPEAQLQILRQASGNAAAAAPGSEALAGTAAIAFARALALRGETSAARQVLEDAIAARADQPAPDAMWQAHCLGQLEEAMAQLPRP
jgi:eukaryotic-like serine/threonine-protein kinase